MQPASSFASTPAATSGQVRWPLLIILASLAAVAPVATDLYLPGFPALASDLDAGASEVQLTLTTFLIGLAVGQLVMGPLSDRYGRRRPLLLSAAASVVAGVVCAAAPNLAVLVGARLVHGFAGAGGMVIGRAVIADLVSGPAAALAFTLVMTLTGVAPLLSPFIGGLLSGPVGWRGMLWAVAAMCAASFIVAVVAIPETHPGRSPGTRGTGGQSVVKGLRTALGRPGYRAPMAVFALAFGVMMSYISASPFVYQNLIGLSAVGYGVLFGVNATGLILAGSIMARLVARFPPRRLVRACVLLQVAATLSFLVLAVTGAPPWTYAVSIFVAVVANGGIFGNSSALAMDHVRDVAGSGSALLGFGQFVLGALVSPLVGLGGDRSAVVPALVMATASVLGLVVSRVRL